MSITFDNEKKYLAAKKKGKVVVKFTAEWCGPCKEFEKTYEDFADEFDDITFISIDIDEYDGWKDVKGISQVPTFKFIRNGKEVDSFTGAKKSPIRKLLSNL